MGSGRGESEGEGGWSGGGVREKQGRGVNEGDEGMGGG